MRAGYSTRMMKTSEYPVMANRFAPPLDYRPGFAPFRPRPTEPGFLLLWLDRQRQRAHLAELDDRLLKDIGVSRPQAIEEATQWT